MDQFASAVLGAVVGALVGGGVTWLVQRSTLTRQIDADAKARNATFEQERASNRDAESRAAAYDMLGVLWLLWRALPNLPRSFGIRLGAGASLDASQGREALDAVDHALQVSAAHLTVKPLETLFDRVATFAQDYGNFWVAARDNDIARNRALTDIQAYVKYAQRRFRAYLDGEPVPDSYADRPNLNRDGDETWVAPDGGTAES